MDAKPFTTASKALESIVTTAFNVEAKPSNSGPSESTKIAATVVVGLGLAGFLVLVGITFVSLAIAFPIAVSVSLVTIVKLIQRIDRAPAA